TTTTTTKTSTDSYFQNVQDQIKVGNLPADTLTKPAGTTTTTTTTAPTTNTAPTTTDGTTTPPPPSTTDGTTTGGGGTVANRTIAAQNDALLETLQGGSGNDTFRVDLWDNYINPNALGTPDILQGGAGQDKLLLASHDTTFTSAMLNAATTGIDSIFFNDAANASVGVTIDNAMIDQSDNDTLKLYTNDTDMSALNVNGITNAAMSLEIFGNSNTVTLVGGAASEITVQGVAMNIMNDGTASLNMGILGGNNTINLGGSVSHIAMLHGGDNTLTLGAGDDIVSVFAGTQYVSGGAGEDSIWAEGGANHTLEGGTGNDHFTLNQGVNGVSMSGGAGDDSFAIHGGSGTIIDGGDGSNKFNITNNANVTIDNSHVAGDVNTYDIHNFSGTANLTFYTDTSIANDQLFLSQIKAGGQINVTLDTSQGVVSNIQVDFLSAGYNFNTYTQSGNDLVITMNNGSGGSLVLGDYFAGKQDYDVKFAYHDIYAALNRSENGDLRVFDEGYSFANVGLVTQSLSVTNGSDDVTVTMVGHGLQTGDVVTFDGFTVGETFDDMAVNDVNGSFVVTVLDNNTFTYTMGHTYTASGAATVAFGNTVDISFDGGMYDTIADFQNQNISGANNQIILAGKGGNDTITAANDSVSTLIHGGDGNDTILASNNDVAKGGQGDDVLQKTDGATNVSFHGGDTTDNGFDVVNYSNQSNYVHVDLNNTTQTTDSISGSFGDFLEGIEGVIGTNQNDVLIGADGIGKYNQLDGRGGADTLTGGTSANNTVDYSWLSTGITVSLVSGAATVTHAQAGNDSLTNIQNIIGGAGADAITGDADSNVFYGGGGADTLIGGLGADVLHGGAGNDMLKMGNGASDNARDTAVFKQGDTGVDSIYEFQADALANAGNAAIQDALDISAMIRTPALQSMNYFELMERGYLSVTQSGADTNIALDLSNPAGGALTTVASVKNTNATDFDWKHFVTSEHSEYLVDSSGSTADDVDDMIVSTGSASIYGYGGDDIIGISGTPTGLTYSAGDGNDTVVIENGAALTAGNTINGDMGMDRLVMDFGAIDFSSFSTASINNFEILDLFGNATTNFQATNIADLTDADNSLYINSSKAGASLALDAASFSLANPENISHLPQIPNIEMGDYTTYVADYSGSEVYVHVNNNVNVTVA
ncbi:MAG: hypothetical protein MK052_11870, partial [Alphaproteobacteria bacterium]|nr:hypothetical protein [Alphaproteobacteria bacterium]